MYVSNALVRTHSTVLEPVRTRRLILVDADCHSFRKLGKRLGMSHWTVREEVKRIRKTIFEMYDNYDKLH